MYPVGGVVFPEEELQLDGRAHRSIAGCPAKLIVLWEGKRRNRTTDKKLKVTISINRREGEEAMSSCQRERSR